MNEQAQRPSPADSADPASAVTRLFATAVWHHQAGALADAERAYRAVLAADPKHADSLHYLGVIALQRGDPRRAIETIGQALALKDADAQSHYHLALAYTAAGRIEAAIDHNRRAVAIDPGHAAAHLNLAVAEIAARRFEDAAASSRRVLELEPNSAAAHNNLGLALRGLGRQDEARDSFRAALALKPDLIEALNNLAKLHLDAGNPAGALDLLHRSHAIRETEETRALLVACFRSGKPLPASETNRHLVLRALAESWTTPDELVGIAEAFVGIGPAADAFRRANAAWPARLPAAELLGAGGLADLGRDPLLRCLLETIWIGSVGMERFATALRAAVLELAAADAPVLARDGALDLACALARQCFINEYVFGVTEAEGAEAVRLRERIAAAVRGGETVPPAWLAAAAAYEPLTGIAGVATLADRDWPGPVAGLLAQQVREPAEEQALRASLPRLTPIEDETSLRVQRQYEENPYPRWVRVGRAPRPRPLERMVRELFPAAPFEPPGREGPVDFLVAGCGTGQHPIERARQIEDARVLAVDLSLASLAYAKRKAQELGVANIEYAQADILRLGAIERRFDVIESSGVLVAIADPFAAWRTLISLLKPGGLMSIGLYSETARRHIAAAQRFLVEHGFAGTADGIRAGRQAIMALPEDAPEREVTRIGDFYSASNCRDLLFHVQESRFTIPQIRAFLAEQELTFLGFALDAAALRRYDERFPDDPARTNLEQWHAFEQDHPDTFISMYQFWVQKRG